MLNKQSLISDREPVHDFCSEPNTTHRSWLVNVTIYQVKTQRWIQRFWKGRFQATICSILHKIALTTLHLNLKLKPTQNIQFVCSGYVESIHHRIHSHVGCIVYPEVYILQHIHSQYSVSVESVYVLFLQVKERKTIYRLYERNREWAEEGRHTVRETTHEISDMFVSYSIASKPTMYQAFIWNRMKSVQVTLMLRWDWCKSWIQT